jgi:3-deoxy-D-manno-octulosonic-acid transferase
MILERAVYNLALPLISAGARAAARFNAKIAEGLEARKGYRPRFRNGARALAGPGPTVWFHVSSVGEFEQAKPVIDLLAERSAGRISIALTFYSPSGMNYFKRFDRSKRNPSIKFVDYLPIDTIGNMRFCLDTIDPDMLVYVKFDLWPNLIFEAASRGIPQILVSGTLSPGSKRLTAIARRFYGSLYAQLSAVAAISDEDAARFAVGAGGATEVVTAGDTRFDQVCNRIDTSATTPPDALLSDGRFYIIAGSTWPGDEAIVIPGFRRLLERHEGIGLILVPHEPTARRLEEIAAALENEMLDFRLYSQLGADSPPAEPVVVADGVGYLAELYRAGGAAYIGGSFSTGVHNVMEPAVLSLPLFFGPRIDNSFEARRLVEIGAGTIVETAGEFERQIGALLADRDLRADRGATAAAFIRNNCGAAVHCVDLIEKFLPNPNPEGEDP